MLQVSRLDVALSEADLNQLVAEFLERPEVDEVRLSLGDGVLLAHVVLTKLGLTVPVELAVHVLATSVGSLQLGVAVTNLAALPHTLKDLALKKITDSLPLGGVSYKQGELLLILDELLAKSSVQFDLLDAAITPEALRLSLGNLRYLPAVAEAVGAEGDPLLPVPVQDAMPLRLPEHQEFYTRLKGKVLEQANRHLPAKLQPLVPWLLLVPDSFALLVRLLRDPRVPRRSKWIAALAVAYFIDPLDLIPDAIPILGQMDDLAVAFFAVDALLGDTPEAVLRELWPGEGDIIVTVREGVRFFNGYLAKGALGKIRALLARRPPAAEGPEGQDEPAEPKRRS